MDWLPIISSFFNVFMVYLVVWWLMVFTVLPYGVEREDTPQKGTNTGAPKIPNLKKKFIITTIISMPVTWAILAIMDATSPY